MFSENLTGLRWDQYLNLNGQNFRDKQENTMTFQKVPIY